MSPPPAWSRRSLPSVESPVPRIPNPFANCRRIPRKDLLHQILWADETLRKRNGTFLATAPYLSLEDQGGLHVHFPPVVLAVRTLLAVSTAGFGRIPFYLASAATLPRCGR